MDRAPLIAADAAGGGVHAWAATTVSAGRRTDHVRRDGPATGCLRGVLFLLGYRLQGGSSLSAGVLRIATPVGQAGGGGERAGQGAGLLLAAALVGVPIDSRRRLPRRVRPRVDRVRIFSPPTCPDGVPSIESVTIYGLIVIPMGHFSTLAGGLALGLIMVPITLRTTEEFLRLVPGSLRDASLALGAPRWVTIARVIVPAGLRGVVAGVLLSLARVAGETAPLLFTAFATATGARAGCNRRPLCRS
jgi:phosphate transport system permease protein